MNGHTEYSVPQQTKALLDEGLLNNPLISKFLPIGTKEAASHVRFSGSNKPRLPVNWRFAESSAALHGLEAALLLVLLEKKYHVQKPEVDINTDHAVLFPMTLHLWTIDPNGENITPASKGTKLEKYFRNTDIHGRSASLYREISNSMYRCADGKWFHLHPSLNPDPVLDALAMPRTHEATTLEDASQPYVERISQLKSQDVWRKIAEEINQAGDICQSAEQYFSSEQGKANAHVGLFELSHISSGHKASWWPDSANTSPARPLAGLKVVDLTRIIAAPSVTRGLAELGASVMRVTSSTISDMSDLHVDLNWGKWNCDLNLKTSEGREALRNLIKDADVVVNGYRPGVYDKYGFSQTDVIDMVSHRDRGIIFVREDCYGWYGPFKHRPGWQPISDAYVGMSCSYGQALDLKDGEPVTPLIPNSDYGTGLSGVIGVLSALIQRAEKGGSYQLDLALNYYSQWLARSVGVYPENVWKELWNEYDNFQFRAEQSPKSTFPKVMKMMNERGFFEDDFFELRRSRVLGVDIRVLKPVINFPNREVRLEYSVGTRGNGIDAPRWPADLTCEVVK